MNQRTIHEEGVCRSTYPDRWSKDLIGGAVLRTTSGFNMGVAEYHTPEFGAPQVHDDQEALYVIQGVGEVLIKDKVYPVNPGTAVYIPPHTKHAMRRTGEESVKVVYAHGAI